jgi:fatty acid desaturase
LYHISAAARYGNNDEDDDDDEDDVTTVSTKEEEKMKEKKEKISFDVYFNRARFVAMKALSLFYMLLLPIYFQGAMRGACLFVLGHLVCGEMLATMFIVNHVIEGVAFAMRGLSSPMSSDGIVGRRETDGKDDVGAGFSAAGSSTAPCYVPNNDWAAVQCQTSVNWSSGSWFWNHVSGGLNHQIEHHLFPSICHTNYVHIQDVVETTCKEYNVPYRSETSLWSAYWKMISHLKMMGNVDSHESFYVEELCENE